MTNNRVVAPIRAGPPDSASTVVTFYDGQSGTFSVVATDPTSDIAVVRAQGNAELIPMSFGSSASLRVGQPVVAVGSPLGLPQVRNLASGRSCTVARSCCAPFVRGSGPKD
jgi:putative serine protease PepD